MRSSGSTVNGVTSTCPMSSNHSRSASTYDPSCVPLAPVIGRGRAARIGRDQDTFTPSAHPDPLWTFTGPAGEPTACGQTGGMQTDTGDGFRIEHDTMGEVRVPAEALWRAQTQRAVENFPISGRGMERAQIRALGLVKGAAARVNARIGVLREDLAAAIAAAADEVAAGGHDAQFPIDVFQTGSGTSSNMNANEVIATLATRASGIEVHPNDHVNASQSSNDVFPTTIHVAATEALANEVVPALEYLAAALRR